MSATTLREPSWLFHVEQCGNGCRRFRICERPIQKLGEKEAARLTVSRAATTSPIADVSPLRNHHCDEMAAGVDLA
ncbi:hypothetical protein BFN03_18000 [Rhodococcus sp. WMMA185]|nr:hypothetical protein BFN03_18000 [Rhodococcus sp. WMMA185]